MSFFDRLRSILSGGKQSMPKPVAASGVSQSSQPAARVEQSSTPAETFSAGVYENVTEFHGRPVRDFDPAVGSTDPAEIISRLHLDWDAAEKGATFDSVFQTYVSSPNASESVGLVIGDWGHCAEGDSAEGVIKAIVAAGDTLRGLKALFLGDIIQEECEISWIQQTDVSPLWEALPALEELRIRGGEGLSLGKVSHPGLKTLVIQTGGLPASVLHEIAAADLPQLEHLQLWLGESNYGWNGSVDDIKGLLEEGKFPKLTYLGLCDSEITDDIAKVVAQAPLLEQLSILDLSLGTLGDDGAHALAESELVKTLVLLDISHHYVGDEALAALNRLGIQVNATGHQKEDIYDDGERVRYIAVSE